MFIKAYASETEKLEHFLRSEKKVQKFREWTSVCAVSIKNSKIKELIFDNDMHIFVTN